ncbi:MAG TPA: hypothetical protein DCS43_12830, partial [Verrucomicrobia bacterium]|nr:hypothetical protein [Verrucomicrobiota bacterium]
MQRLKSGCPYRPGTIDCTACSACPSEPTGSFMKWLKYGKSLSHITELGIKRLSSTPWIPLVLPLAAAWLAYGGVVHCDFIGLDDDLYVYENLIVQQGLTWPGIRWAFSAFYASTWQPLVWLSYMTDVSLSGVEPAALHRTNLLLHLINIILVYSCLLQLTGRRVIALATALLFALHPVHVESVAWVAGRKDVLSTPFWWAAILAYLAYARKPSVARYLAVLLLLVLGLMAKPMLMTLPAILLLLDIWPLRRVSMDAPVNWRTVLIEKLPLLMPVLVSVVITFHVQATGESLLDMETISLWGRFSNASVSVWRYIGSLLWPANLAVLYPHPGAWPILVTMLTLAASAAAMAVAWKQRQRCPWLLPCLLWYLITLVPVIGLVQFGWHAMADRFLYIPAIGLYTLAAIGFDALWRCSRSWQLSLGIAAVGLTLGLIGLTNQQVNRWNDSLSLFSHAATVTRDNWMMHNGVGTALSRKGRNDEAAPHFEKAIQIKPDRPKLHFNLGHVRFMQQRWPEAIACFKKSIELNPTDRAYYNLAVAQARSGDLGAAEATYRQIL